MGASFSTWARWGDTVVQRTDIPVVQNFGPNMAMFQGVQGVTINGGVFNVTGGCLTKGTTLEDLLNFLSLVNFRTIQLENFGKWAPGTVKWLLESSMFQFWLETQCAILWGTGMPGAGKTILASVALDYLEKKVKFSKDVCLAFVYCRYTEPMSVRDILAALVRQLIERFPHLSSFVGALYTKHNLERTKPTQQELLDVIQSICGCFRISYFFIDGLDEAIYDKQFDLLAALQSIRANFFITSRPLIRLKDDLPNATFFDIAAQNEDIKLLVSQQIDRSPDLRQILVTKEARERVIVKICESSCGMFLHASLMIQAIGQCTNLRSVMNHLDKLPPRLDVLYEEAFSRIESQGPERAALGKDVLTWVVFAYRPLTVKEVQYAVVQDPEVDWKYREDVVPESLLVSACCGLVVVESEAPKIKFGAPQRILRLVHYTALDALKGLLAAQSQVSPHCRLMETSFKRLISCKITTKGSIGLRPFTGYFTWLPYEEPLLQYAYESWYRHVRESIPDPSLSDAEPIPTILRFLEECTSYPALFLKYNKLVAEDPRYDTLTLPIHLISFYRLGPLLPYVKPTTGGLTVEGRSALWLASHRNDSEVVAELLKLENVDVNLDNGKGWSPLMAAAAERSTDTLKTLLCDPRVDVNKQDKHGFTALHLALQGKPSEAGTQTALNLIAAPGVDVNAGDDSGVTPLMLAYDHPTRLLDALIHHPNIDLHKRDHHGRTPLMHACEKGRSETVHRYLRLPDVDARDKSGATALTYRARHLSSYSASQVASDFRALLDAGLEVNAKDAEGRTALAHAAREGRLEAVQALLQIEHIDANPQDNAGGTILMHACIGDGWQSNLEVVKFFLDRPEHDLNARDENGRTALIHSILSSTRGLAEREPLISTLLNRPELQVNIQDENGMTAIAHAVITSVLVSASNLVNFFYRADDISIARQGVRNGRRFITLRQGETDGFCELAEVPEVAVHLRAERIQGHSRSNYQQIVVDCHATAAHILEMPASLPPAPWKSHTVTRVQEISDYGATIEKRLDALAALGFGFPWKTGWIAKGRESNVIHQFFSHPKAEDDWFGYLRNAWPSDGEVSNDGDLTIEDP